MCFVKNKFEFKEILIGDFASTIIRADKWVQFKFRGLTCYDKKLK